MKKITFLLLVISLFHFSCSNTTTEKSNQQSETAIHQEHQQDSETQIIELNNGEKWKIDDTMLVHIRNMENDVHSFTTTEQKNYKLLADKLQKNIDLLTSSCTMIGKAHDELHIWLLPYIDLVNELSKANDKTENAKQFENIQTSFKIFNQYFQ